MSVLGVKPSGPWDSLAIWDGAILQLRAIRDVASDETSQLDKVKYVP